MPASSDQRPFFLNRIKIKMLLLSQDDRLTTTSPTPIAIKRRSSNSFFRSPVGPKVYASAAGKDVEKEFECQVSYKQTELRELSNQGDFPISAGHIVFSSRDLCNLTNQDEVPRKGDLITAIKDSILGEFRIVDYKIIHVTQKGHIGFNTLGSGGGILTKMFFEQNRERTQAS